MLKHFIFIAWTNISLVFIITAHKYNNAFIYIKDMMLCLSKDQCFGDKLICGNQVDWIFKHRKSRRKRRWMKEIRDVLLD